VFEYAAGEMRDYCRGTRAHNTVEVDGMDQIETWSSFRVGRRSQPYGVRFGAIGDGFSFRALFPGYRKMIGDDILLERVMGGDTNGVSVTDRVSGRGTHRMASYVHLHPNVEVERIDGTTIAMSVASELCVFNSIRTPVSIETGWYCPKFGSRQANSVLVMEQSGQLPIELGYTLQFRAP
jgi:uncharacterized heparinase superfamily protein